MIRSKLNSLSVIAVVAASALSSPTLVFAKQVVTLTQTACQFLESENNTNHGFKSDVATDCEKINASSGAERLASAKTIELKAGKTIFKVTNKDVPYDLGFWIRAESLLDRVSLPSTSGGGLSTGATKDYEIDLKPGQYVYSCPLNPTLDYKIVVR